MLIVFYKRKKDKNDPKCNCGTLNVQNLSRTTSCRLGDYAKSDHLLGEPSESVEVFSVM